MVTVTLQLPPDPDVKIVAELRKVAKVLAPKAPKDSRYPEEGDDEILEQTGAAPSDSYSLTLHVYPDPETPGELEE